MYPKFGPDSEFILETDASYVGLGAVLSHRQEDGKVHPIAYASRSLDVHEKKYGVTELETLGLVWAVRYFRPYLLGHKTTVFTDHSACLSLLNHPRPSGKLARWALTIQEMNLVIKHRSGKPNTNTDALSRNPVHERTTNKNSCKDDEDVESSPSEENHTNENLPCRISAQPHECAPKPSFSVNGCEEVVAGCFNANACTEKKNVSDCDCMQKATRATTKRYHPDTLLSVFRGAKVTYQ